MSVAHVQEFETEKTAPVAEKPRPVLIVEDDLDAIEELSEILEFEGWKPLTARNVAGALAVIENSDVQLVVTDVHLGSGTEAGETGIQLISRAQSRFPERNLSFIVLSGDVDAVKSSLQTDAVDFLLKPVASDDLVRALGEAEQWAGKERNLSEFAQYLIRKSGEASNAKPPPAGAQSPNNKLITTEFDLERRLTASSDEKSFVIQYAVASGHVQTWLSPILCADGSVLSLDAVPRWTENASSAPDVQAFLDHARAADWAKVLDETVRSQAAEALFAHKDSMSDDHRMSVLFPAEQLMRDDGVPNFLRALHAKEVSPEQVIAEVTYVPAMNDTSDLLVKSHLGCFAGGILRVDAQDFSIACGFVSRMRSFGFGWVRLSMDSLPGWHASPDARAEIKALISIAHATGSKMIVDHVDTPEALEWLKSECCDAFQGTAVAAVVAPDQIGTFCKEGAVA